MIGEEGPALDTALEGILPSLKKQTNTENEVNYLRNSETQIVQTALTST